MIASDEDGVVPVGEQPTCVPARDPLWLVDGGRSEQACWMDPVVKSHGLVPVGAVPQRLEGRCNRSTGVAV